MDDRMREMLRRRADDTPSQRQVPDSLTARARRRMALNALGVVVAVVVVAGGAFAGIQTLGGGSSGQPASSGGDSSSVEPRPSTPNAPPALPTCSSEQLRADATMEGAAGSREGTIDLSNYSDTTCTLQGNPPIRLLDQNLEPIRSPVTFSLSPAQWQAEGSPRPAGWPVVTLPPGQAAQIRIRWSNWCPDFAPLWRVEIPDSGSVDVLNGMDSISPPPCNGPDQPSEIEVGPFEPAR